MKDKRVCTLLAKDQKGLTATGIEPATLGLLDPRSNQLSYAVIHAG